ncbi:MAG: MarR family winged helix-turn-helix transcriptional regulator [Eubacteriales bacterium]
MADTWQVEEVLAQFDKLHPQLIFEEIYKRNAGCGALIKFLDESKKPVTAGDISRFMNVSTARVAVLLKKLEAKGLIVKETDLSDARVTAVRLSEEGRATAKAMRDALYSRIGLMIDRIGMERLNAFVETIGEIQKIVIRPDIGL